MPVTSSKWRCNVIPAVKSYNDIKQLLDDATCDIEHAANMIGINADYYSRKAIQQRKAFKKLKNMIAVGRNDKRIAENRYQKVAQACRDLQDTYYAMKKEIEELKARIPVILNARRCVCCQKIFIIGEYCEECSKKKLDEVT